MPARVYGEGSFKVVEIGSNSTSNMTHKSIFQFQGSYLVYRRKLLEWIRKEVQDYGIIVPSLTSLADSFAFTALVHKYDPTLIDYEGYDRNNTHDALANIFAIAEEALSIPNLLDVQSVIDGTDPRSLLLYISHFQNLFENAQTNIHNEIVLVKESVHNLLEDIETYENRFIDSNTKFDLLLQQDVLEEEKSYFIDREQELKKQIQAYVDLTAQLMQQNKLLTEKNLTLIKEKENWKETAELDSKAKDKYIELLNIEEDILAIGGLLNSDIQTVEDYKTLAIQIEKENLGDNSDLSDGVKSKRSSRPMLQHAKRGKTPRNSMDDAVGKVKMFSST
eukprot:TRINITY_DN3406_c0_g1_i3.p1 TRINITY_DN3406_c0_g1~~TRINITY_DN3406_c0_g1_i3.p1  ORF type:complete len:335 (-),score=88.24 TRINITY_DN3406_c0_g1_i3:67-1071(-)